MISMTILLHITISLSKKEKYSYVVEKKIIIIIRLTNRKVIWWWSTK